MNQVQVSNRTITPAEVIPMLASYRMLPLLWREVIIDSAIAPIQLSQSEQNQALDQFYKKHQLSNQVERQAWSKRYGMSFEQLNEVAIRELKIEKFKQATWESKLESHFLSHKAQLDKVVYSLIRTKQSEIVQELFFRIRAGEQSFAELAREYSQGSEAHTDGLIGPVELSVPHPHLAKMLAMSKPGQLWHPTRLGEWFVIVRLEKLIPAQLDEVMRQQLLHNLFEQWISEQFALLQQNVTSAA